MKNTTSNKPCPRTQLAEVLTSQVYLHGNVAALRQLVAELESPLISRAQHAVPAGDQWNPQNYIHNLIPSLDPRLAPAHAALAVLEASPEYQEAEAVIAPLLKALAELEVAEQIARQDLADRQREHAAALAAATEKALAAAALDPAVVKAAAALENLS